MASTRGSREFSPADYLSVRRNETIGRRREYHARFADQFGIWLGAEGTGSCFAGSGDKSCRPSALPGVELGSAEGWSLGAPYIGETARGRDHAGRAAKYCAAAFPA